MTTPPQPKQDQVFGGRYHLSAQIGAGGMGAVFEAHDELLQRRVAIKLLPPELQSDRVARERLRGEALAAAALDHPFICKIHEIGETDGRLFVVMEYVEGETLHDLAGRSMLPMRQIVEMATEIVEALDEAHRRGLIHRDLKPSNIMLTSQGHVKVMDFGLAKQLKPAAERDKAAATVLTDSGTRIGTPAYMSPEQVLGGPLDPRSDIFSLGVILHELATGLHPFRRDDSTETMAAILRDPPTGGSRDLESLPGLAAVVGRMLAKACAERPQSMRELRVEIEALRERAWASGSSSVRVATPEPSIERTPFIGRDAETAELWRLLDRMLTRIRRRASRRPVRAHTGDGFRNAMSSSTTCLKTAGSPTLRTASRISMPARRPSAS
jgi:serine/threonine protein kinase